MQGLEDRATAAEDSHSVAFEARAQTVGAAAPATTRSSSLDTDERDPLVVDLGRDHVRPDAADELAEDSAGTSTRTAARAADRWSWKRSAHGQVEELRNGGEADLDRLWTWASSANSPATSSTIVTPRSSSAWITWGDVPWREFDVHRISNTYLSQVYTQT